MQDFASLETDERFQIIRRLTENQHPAAAVALLKIIFSDRNLRVRRSAAAGLLELPEDQAASALAAALEEEDPEVRMRAVRVLGKAANYKALEPLADALAFDLDSRVRRTVVSTLAALPEMDTADHIDVKGLVEAAARWDTDFGVREAATITFELLRNKIDVVE